MSTSLIRQLVLVAGVLAFLNPGTALADPLLAAGDDSDLDAQVTQHERQFYTLNAYPFGLSLDVHVAGEAEKARINEFLEQTATDDYEAVTGEHPFETILIYGEFGDLGFFGGIAMASTAYQYMTLKRDGAPEEMLARARARVVRAAESWHVFYAVGGHPGQIARGIRRVLPEDPTDPPFPGPPPEIIPLFDEDGNPLPEPKDNGSYRADNSGGALPADAWVWVDSASKDQLSGQVFGMVALYDAMKDDPDIDQSLVTRMEEDALGVGRMLMEKRIIDGVEGVVGSGEYDLIIMDADGRYTMYHDLNPLSVEKIYLPQGAPQYNLFNLMLAQGVIKGLYHVTGDPELEEYLYDELYDNRGWLDKIAHWDGENSIDYIYNGVKTNFDDPDMTSIALWLSLYLEKDPEVRAVLEKFLEESWWERAGESHTARLCKQPLWHSIYMTITESGFDEGLLQENVNFLKSFSLGPYWNDARENCDASELEAGECLAVDGETVLTIDGTDDSGRPMASEALDPSIRPPSNFDARSNPFTVNGGGGNRLNPGGDLLAAYWFMRYQEKKGVGEANVSPFVRDHMPVGGWPDPVEEMPDVVEEMPDAVTEDNIPEVSQDVAAEVTADTTLNDAPAADAGAEPEAGSGSSSSCAVASHPSPNLLVLLAGLLLALVTRRRKVRC